jgi:hypothetical protein
MMKNILAVVAEITGNDSLIPANILWPDIQTNM